MKKVSVIFICALFATTLIYGQNKRVAVVTFYVDKYINANKIVETSREATYELTKKDDPRFDLRPILQDFHKTFMKDYVKKFPFDVIPEEEVLNHAMFKAYKGLDGIEDPDSANNLNDEINDRFIAIEGYNVLLTGGNMLRSWRTESHLITILEDMNVDGVMFIYLHYAWEPKVAVGGLGNCGIRAYITMELFNKEAKKVFNLEEHATSKKGVALVQGAPIFNYDKLMPMCERATDELLDDLNKKLPKYIKKVDKKL